MTRSDMLSMARLYVPEAPSTVVSNVNAYIFLNNAAQEFVKVSDCLPTSTDFTCTADDKDYSLSSVASTYLKIRQEGLWFYNTTTSKWVPLDGTTLEYMQKNFPTWINDSSGVPARYWIDGDVLWIHPTPAITKASTGFKLYHYAKATDTSADTHYYFSGSTTQYPWLAAYEEYLLEYYKWKVNQILGYDNKSESAKQMFYAQAAKAKQEFLYRPDLKKQFRFNRMGNMSHFNGMFKV